jgi:hypothetical protein
MKLWKFLLVVVFILFFSEIYIIAQTQGLTEPKLFELYGRCTAVANTQAENLNILSNQLATKDKEIEDLKQKCGKACK